MKRQLNQAELIKKMTDKELLVNLYVSQGIVLIIGIVASFFLFESFGDWFREQIHWNSDVLYFGVIPALFVVLVDFALMKFFPESYYDDGGINKRIFQNRNLMEIISITALVAISEEVLFRGVIHLTFGYIIGSISFALIHFRYLRKPILLISIIFISFFIGYMYEITGNLLVTIIAHFLIDFILALFIKIKWGGEHDSIREGEEETN